MKDEKEKFFQSNKLKIFLAIWLLAAGFGMYLVTSHANKPAEPVLVAQRWPTSSKLFLAKDRPTVILFAHPKCPCTRATIGELAILMAHTQNRAQVYVLFTKPKNYPNEWQETDTWQSAKSIPGVEVISDPQGQEANFFQAFTSGQTLVYNSEGKLLFSGGITSARGHSGDNAGRSAVTNIINNNTISTRNTPVFGCTLCLPSNDKNAPKSVN